MQTNIKEPRQHLKSKDHKLCSDICFCWEN